jgi:hypothetical protein
VNFQVTVLKILASYPRGHAAMADLKRDMAILATSGREWAERTKRLAARVPGLDIFSQGLVERLDGGWQVTDKGRAVLEMMEARPASQPLQAHVHEVTAPEPAKDFARQFDFNSLARRNQRRQARRRLRSERRWRNSRGDHSHHAAGSQSQLRLIKFEFRSASKETAAFSRFQERSPGRAVDVRFLLEDTMIKRQLMTTTAAILISTAAFAQSNSKDVPSASPSAQQTDKSAPTPQTSNPSATTSTQSQVSPPPASAQTPSASTTSQTQNTATDSSRTNQNSTATSGGSNNTSAQGSHQPATASQTQSGQPATNQQQSTNPPPSTDAHQAQQTPAATGNSSNPSAQRQDTQQNAAGRTGSETTNVSVQLNDTQRTRLSESVSHLNLQPLTNVNFSVSVGTAIPRDVRLQQLPADVVEIVPQYRGYNFVLVRDEIVIVDPSSYQIVATMPYSGRSTAAAPAPREQRKVTFSDRDRETVRKHVRAAPVERRTTGSTVRTEIRRGERVPDSVEIEAFPEEVYRDAPTLREYRYIHRDSRTYIVEPQERRVIEEID